MVCAPLGPWMGQEREEEAQLTIPELEFLGLTGNLNMSLRVLKYS